MIEIHPSIDVNEYAEEIRISFHTQEKMGVFNSFNEVEDWEKFDSALIYVSVMCVSINWSDVRNIRESVAIRRAIYVALGGHPKCKDIVSFGGNILAIFDTPFKTDINAALDCVGKVNSLIEIANIVHRRMGQPQIHHKIGMTYGKNLLAKGIRGQQHEFSWSGSGLDEAVRLANGDEGDSYYLLVTSSIYANLKEDYQKLFCEVGADGCYGSNPVNIEINKWIKSNL